MDTAYLPLITIFGPIIGAIIGAGVTYFLVIKRKRVTFWLAHSEDLTTLLRSHRRIISIKVDDKDVRTLNRTKVAVKNTGNTTIAGLTFQVVILGEHGFVAPEVSAGDVKLEQAIQTELTKGPDPYVVVTVPFLNPKEAFEVQIFFDGKTGDCEVHCRMEDVSVKFKTLGYDDMVEMAGTMIQHMTPLGERASREIAQAVKRALKR